MERIYRHHYVPEWYQKSFMKDGQTAYFRLDLNPDTITKPDGEVITKKNIHEKGPKQYFFEVDLYTTKYFGKENDDIERYLFGSIDNKGSKALPAFISTNWKNEIHSNYLNFFEYMDAQKLRTIKGLTWLTTFLKPKDYNDLLIKMQTIRQMHSTIWIEAKMEIVSAEDSDIKFLVSDNPVTTYNPSLDLNSKQCQFPFDPEIQLIGTRTIFPINLNYCAILTNLEYTKKDTEDINPLQPRTNARFFDDTIGTYLDIIRGRKLNMDSVAKINYILKNRATKYIAAAEEEWLFPEKYISIENWSDLDDVLFSSEFNKKGYPGEIFVGGKDGELIMTQDEFGRKPTTEEEWKKKNEQAKRMTAHVHALLEKEKADGRL